ncbi:class I SAM-dependent RNA methyltransferase [Sphingorhabdus sp. Alg239-R122]|uniref:class I SAM-dependent RNA methyltransferase n=1 Tax=Sphingorhabdus sp. Alg239-R122 TaxID=2305989 RepID=UPI0013DA71C7|nr:class I SAM-dependent RNA methyltransferase [Sphingorhabdus sp. Alg239-R122]
MGEEIVRIAARGDGITESGKHVPMSAPGDVLQEDGGLAWGAHHVMPPCQHFELCGGCNLQQLDDVSYAEFVRDRVANSIDSQGLQADEIAAAVLSPPQSRRRVGLRAIRMGRKLHIGFHTGGSHRVIDMQQCEVMRPELFALVAPLRQLLDGWPGKSLSCVVDMTLVDQGADIHIKNLNFDGLEQTQALLDFARENGLARLSMDQGYGPEAIWEPEPATMSFSGHAVGFPAGAFLQPTREGEDALVAAAKEALHGSKVIADLFCGIGTFALHLTGGRKIYAGEASRDALMALKMAANMRQLPIFADHRDLYRKPLMAEELNRFEAVLLDPPRSGAKEQVGELALSTVPKICYISCNPVSWARDAKKLCQAGYRIRKIWPVGQFRWSTHVELVSLFEKVES